MDIYILDDRRVTAREGVLSVLLEFFIGVQRDDLLFILLNLDVATRHPSPYLSYEVTLSPHSRCLGRKLGRGRANVVRLYSHQARASESKPQQL